MRKKADAYEKEDYHAMAEIVRYRVGHLKCRMTFFSKGQREAISRGDPMELEKQGLQWNEKEKRWEIDLGRLDPPPYTGVDNPDSLKPDFAD